MIIQRSDIREAIEDIFCEYDLDEYDEQQEALDQITSFVVALINTGDVEKSAKAAEVSMEARKIEAQIDELQKQLNELKSR